MNTTIEAAKSKKCEGDVQLVTFSVGEICFGIDIAYVQEINRHLDVTKVPESSPMIHGVVNLRGDVVTVFDPHYIFGLGAKSDISMCRNLVLNIDGERFGVLVDRVSDILTIQESELSRRPSNVSQVDSQFIDSVYLRSNEIVVVLDPIRLLNCVEHSSEV